MIFGDIIAQYIGDSPAIYMIAGLSLIIVLNLVITIWLAATSKEIDFEIMPDFIKPIITYGLFILLTEALTIAAKGSSVLYEIFVGLQILGVITIALKYVKKSYDKLKKLGMPSDSKIDQAFEDKFDSVTTETRDQLYQVLSEYFTDKENKNKGEL